MFAAHLTGSRTCRNSATMLYMVGFVMIAILIMVLGEANAIALPLDTDGLKETSSGESEEMSNFKKTKDLIMNNRNWTMVDFLLCFAVLFVVIVCVVFCYFLGVFEACKRSSRRTGDDQYDRRTIRGKGFAGCADCID